MGYDDVVGRTQVQEDEVTPRLMRGMAAALGVAEPAALPPLWHWMLFQDWAPAPELGPDGHPKRGGFLPPVHGLPRRMWAGGRLSFHQPLHAGERVRRTSSIEAVREKQGGSGQLVFVTVKHEIEGEAGLAIEEAQDIVYRGTEGAAVKAAAAAEPAPPGSISRNVVPDPVLLFRYSALTGNGHRIHYDLGYARDEEGYPGLVVHGPLQATWLAGLMHGRRLTRFNFKGVRPAFHGRRLTLEAWESSGGFALRTRDADGAACMQATAEIA